LRGLLGADAGLADIHKLYACHDKLLAHKTALFDHLVRRCRELFNVEFDALLYDLTSTYFEANPPLAEEDKRRFGYSRDKRPDCVQVGIALVLTLTSPIAAQSSHAALVVCVHARRHLRSSRALNAYSVQQSRRGREHSGAKYQCAWVRKSRLHSRAHDPAALRTSQEKAASPGGLAAFCETHPGRTAPAGGEGCGRLTWRCWRPQRQPARSAWSAAALVRRTCG